MPSLEDAYWQRQPVLLEACSLLQREVSDSLGGHSDYTCDFRIIELPDLVAVADAKAETRFDVWRDSAGLIMGRVTAPTGERLQEARRVTAKLFTIHEDQESAAIYVIPPWAKPAAWNESLTLPTHLTIRFTVNPATVENEEAETISLFQPLTLALSGGGVRATLYQLGILVFLAQENRLKDVREIVSVSGGSILAAHFLKHWSEATGQVSEFRRIAAQLLVICRSDIRNRIFVPWIWSRLLPWSYFSRNQGRTGRLLAQYQRVFEATTLGDLSESRPHLAFVATDGIQHQRVAFTASQILRWNIQDDDHSTPAPILSKGVELSLAVAASSCFPPVFPRLHLTHDDLGITFGEFKEVLYLDDGGVVTNLGIEVLIALRKLEWTKGKLVLIADAERGLAVKPGDSPMASIDASLAALSKSARDAAKREFGANGISIPFANRVQNNDGLTIRAETAMFNYRTDLDGPTWQEIHGLMIHGAMMARQTTLERFRPVSADTLKQMISTIIAEAGGPANSTMPTEVDFRRSGKRHYGQIWFHSTMAILLALTLLGGLIYGAIRVITTQQSRGREVPDVGVHSTAASEPPNNQRSKRDADREMTDDRQTDERRSSNSPGETRPAPAAVIGEWESSNDSDEASRREPPLQDHVVAEGSKSFAEGKAEAKLAKGGPSGTFLWAHLHGVHPDLLGSTTYRLAVLVRDEGGYYYMATPRLESKVEGVLNSPGRSRHSFGQFHLSRRDAAKALSDAVDGAVKLIIEVNGTRENKGFFGDVPEQAKKLIGGYLGEELSQTELLTELNKGKSPK